MATALLDPETTNPVALPLMTLYYEVKAAKDRFTQYRLLEATHYKHTDMIAHEFLILQIFDGTHTLPLCMERRPSTWKGEGPGASIRTPIADDSIKRVQNFDAQEWARRYRKIQVARCPNMPAVTLWDICQIFHTMWRMSQKYKLMSQQCYWLCIAFLLFLGQLPSVEVMNMKGKDFDLRGVFGGDVLGRVFRSIPICVTGSGLRVITEEDIKREFEEFIETEEKKGNERRDDEDADVRNGFERVINRKKKRSEKDTKRARRVVQPLLVTSSRRAEVEEQRVKDSFSRVVRGRANRDTRTDELMTQALKGI